MTLITPVPYVLNSSSASLPIRTPVWSATETYNLGDEVFYAPMRTIYKAKSNVGAGLDPVSHPELWEFVEVPNQYKMFDQYLNTQTVHNDIISIDISGGNIGDQDLYITDLYFGNLHSEKVRIRAYNSDNDLLEDVTFDLKGGTCDNWFDYFSMNWYGENKTEVLYSTNFVTPASRYVIDFYPLGGVTKVGITLFGKSYRYGAVQYDAKVRVIDYSKTETNEAGYSTLVKGYSTHLVDIDVVIPTRIATQLRDKLKQAKGLPLVLSVGKADLLQVYGTLEDVEIILSSPVWSTTNLIIKGLI